MMNAFSLLLNILVTSATAAPVAPASSVRKVDLNQDLKNNTFISLYELDPKKPVKLSPLAQLKNHEIQGRWSECVNLAPKVFSSQKELRGWVAQTWLHCLSQAQEKKTSVGQEDKVLSAIAKSWAIFEEGPWADSLWNTWVEQELSFLDSEVKKKNRVVESRIERLLDHSPRLSREQKAQCFQLLGDLALARNEYQEAQFMYEESQSFKDSKYLTDKLDFLAKTRNQQVAKPTTTPSVEAIGEDGKLEDRIRAALKLNDLIPAMKDSVTLLNQYPGSRSARRLKDKPLEIYNSISDKMIAEKALNEMQEADASKLLEWAQNLHRKGEWASSMVLAQKAYDKNPQSPTVTSLLWVVGRSAHFLGQYDKALEAFAKLINNANGSDEAAEALFRSGLIYYRQKDYTTAAALLDRLVQQGRDRYSLNAQYWLVRSLEAANNKDRAQKTAAALIERYPFSYYGLRLRSESQGNKYVWPASTDKDLKLESTFFVVGTQKKSWERFKAWTQAGWVTEAQTELGDMPYMKDPALKVTLASKLAERGQYYSAIRAVNDALDMDPRLRQEQFLKLGYPQVYQSLYQKESDRYGIDVVLLRSLTRQESAFNLRTTSTSNAMGLMQMIPPTAQEVAKKLGMKINLPDDMFRPEVNIPMGSFYVSEMLGQFQNNIPFTLAAYNAGPYRLKKWIEGREEISSALANPSSEPVSEVWFDELPWNETSFYVKAILRNVLLYRMIGKEAYTPSLVLWSDLLNKKAK
jgi:soluble lytic murein transglycosylase